MSIDQAGNRHRRVRRPAQEQPAAMARNARRAIVGSTLAAKQARALGVKEKTADAAKLEALLMRHVQATEEATSIAIRVKDTYLALEAALKEAGVKALRAGDWVAEYVTAKGRASHTIDPAGFRKLVKNDEDFYGAISVNSTEAKRLLATKALEGITKTVPAKEGAPTLKVGKAT